MKLQDTREQYYFYTGKVSEIVRQLGFAGIAIIWVFKTESAGRPVITKGLIPAGMLILLGLAADLLQYAVGTVIWDRFNQSKEDEMGRKQEAACKKGHEYDPEAEDFTAPSSINQVTKVLFWTKFVLMFLAYAYLVGYLILRVL